MEDLHVSAIASTAHARLSRPAQTSGAPGCHFRPRVLPGASGPPQADRQNKATADECGGADTIDLRPQRLRVGGTNPKWPRWPATLALLAKRNTHFYASEISALQEGKIL